MMMNTAMQKTGQTMGFDISQLVDDLKPVRPLRTGKAIMVAVAITAALVAAIVGLIGLRADVAAGLPDPMFLIRTGVLGLLGLATGHTVLSMATPSVGKHNLGWHWALGAALVFPAAGLILLSLGAEHQAFSMAKYGAECLRWSAAGAIVTAIPMVYWLRQGAPTSPERAGWLTGLASGRLGAFAFNFHCTFNDIIYIGFWYGLAVAGCAVAGRLIVPSLIRW